MLYYFYHVSRLIFRPTCQCSATSTTGLRPSLSHPYANLARTRTRKATSVYSVLVEAVGTRTLRYALGTRLGAPRVHWALPCDRQATVGNTGRRLEQYDRRGDLRP